MFNNVRAGFFVLSDFYNSEVTPRRKVKMYEIEVIKSNSGAIFLNDTRYQHSGQNLLYAKNGDDRFTIGKLECYYLKFTCDDKHICRILDKIESGMVQADSAKLVEEILAVAKLIPENNPGTLMEQMAHICKAVSILCANQPATKKQHKINDIYTNRIIEAKEYIDAHYNERITLEDLASRAFLSPNFFRVKFLEIVGISPHDYLVQVRIHNAKTLLSDTDIPLSHIAIMCGFDSQAYMNYVFKKETDFSPGSFRKQNL